MAPPEGCRPAKDSASAARRDYAHSRLAELFPDGTVPISEEAISRTAQRAWVAEEIEERERRPYGRQTEKLREPWLPGTRREIGLDYLSRLCGEGLPITEDTLNRTMDQGWVERAVEAREKAALAAVRKEQSELDSMESFVSRTRAVPADGHGDWYECDLPRDLAATDLARALELARRYPDDLRAQETVCQVLARAASTPLHLDMGRANAGRIGLVSGEGLEVVMAAMRHHCSAARLQWRACQVLWHITDTAASARSAEAAGAVEAIASAMLRFPGEKSLQRAATAALVNIAKHREKVPLGHHLRETISVAASALKNFQNDTGIQSNACTLLWHLATEEPLALASHPGLRRLVEHASSTGVKEARWLLECVRWRSPTEEHVDRGGSRQRWGQWAAGRHAAA